MPWKFRDRPIEKQWHEHTLVRIALALLIGLFLVSLPYGWNRYQHWLEVRRLVRAHAAFVKGDFREALLNARMVVRKNPANDVALQLIKGSTEALQSPEAMSWQRAQKAMETGDTDHLLGLADAFVTAGDFLSADRMLQRIRSEDRDSARFHRLSAKVAANAGDLAAAALHWDDAVRIEPDNDTQQLDRAAFQLTSPDPRVQALGLAAIDKLKLKPETRLPALRLLLDDAKRNADRARAREVAQIIASDRDAEFSDQLALLSALRALRPKREDEFKSQLAHLQQSALTEPEQLFALAAWMIDNDLALAALEWTAKLPPEFVSKPPIAAAVAQALVRAADWTRLRAKVEPESWGDGESMRLGFLALAIDRLGDPAGGDNTWQQALDATGGHPIRLEKLARASYAWDAKRWTEKALWALAESDWCPRWAMDYLWAAALERSDTAKLYEVTTLRLKAQPDDLVTRNNHIALAVLTGQDTAATRAQAEALHREYLDHAGVASTYGLVLLQQGKAADAVAMMKAYKPAELSDPSVALYFGTFLAAAGETQEAEKYLALAQAARPLPEERRLLEVATALNRTRAIDRQGEDTATAQWNQTLDTAGTQIDLLELLSRVALGWGWQTRADAALLKLATLDRCPEWAREPMWAAALRTGDSPLMQRVGRLIARNSPENVIARANAAALALLGDREPDSARAQADSLYAENPDVPEVVACYGLGLIRQGRPDDAVAAITRLKPEALDTPRMSLFHGIFLAAAGRAADAEPLIKAGAEATQFPEEKELVRILQLAFDTAKHEAGGDAKAADGSWNEALTAAARHGDWLEMLTRIAVKSGAPRHADAALWRLAETDRCPRWALDQLSASTATSGTAAQRYKLSKLLVKADPKNTAARVESIVLALLTAQEMDAAHRQSESLYKTNPAGPGVAPAFALSLHFQQRDDEALKILEALPPEQLREPRTALIYGVILAATGQITKGTEQLRAAKAGKLFPEEQALVEKTLTAQPGAPQ